MSTLLGNVFLDKETQVIKGVTGVAPGGDPDDSQILASKSYVDGLISGAPSVPATQVAFGDNANEISSSSRFTWDETQKRLGVDGILAKGDFGSGVALTPGAGVRMHWYPKKAAFRAGTAIGTDWDDSKIGVNSAAFGNSSRAFSVGSMSWGDQTLAITGSNATSWGNVTFASGFSATAFGFNSQATGNQSTAFGANTIAQGGLALAIGQNTRAKSYACFALGQYNIETGTTTAWVATDPVLTIGNGTSDVARSNAFEVLKNGNTAINGTVDISGTTTVDTSSQTALELAGNGEKRLVIEQSNGAVDQKRWYFAVSGGAFQLGIQSDNGITSSPQMQAFRSGLNVTEWVFNDRIRTPGGFTTEFTPDPSAIAHFQSTTKGFLPPRGTTSQKNAIASPANGLIFYDTDLDKHYAYNGAWVAMY